MYNYIFMDSILSNTRLFKITIVFILIDNLKDKYIVQLLIVLKNLILILNYKKTKENQEVN